MLSTHSRPACASDIFESDSALAQEADALLVTYFLFPDFGASLSSYGFWERGEGGMELGGGVLGQTFASSHYSFLIHILLLSLLPILRFSNTHLYNLVIL